MAKISIIIPSYNYAEYLPECIDSIASQSFPDWEAIIVDDGSTDETPEIANSLVAISPARIKYFRTDNLGVTNARNTAAGKACGDYILPLDADDLLVPESLTIFSAAIESSPSIGFAYCAVQNFGTRAEDNGVWHPGPYSKDRFIWENLAACTSIWRRDLFLKGAKYRPVIFEDWDLWLQIIALGYEGLYIPQPLFKYRIHHQGRNTLNKNRYRQSLIEEILLNPSLYSAELLPWAKSAAINFPKCFALPSIVILPAPGGEDYSEISPSTKELVQLAVERGHFAAMLGNYTVDSEAIPGLIQLNYNPAFSVEQVKSEVYKLGRSVIVFSALGKDVESELYQVNNVASVIDLNRVNALSAEAKLQAALEDFAKKAPARPKDTVDAAAHPKISVVTVSYNQAEFIKQNIESVLAQNYPNFEHIVIDGGSTDGTVEILKSYPHLKWVSEPDRGQTHALNKGFRRASGEIIAWLNSDDWYPPGVFHDVAAELKEKKIVIGECEVRNKDGSFREHVPNVARGWFDVLKYWIFFSSPAQPSIFFKREILEEFKNPDGTYLDEALDFCMDYEFWLRIGKRYPLTHHLPRVLSYCRTYDTNKTGRDMDSVYREMSRVFSRYTREHSERSLSFILPAEKVDESLMSTIESISSQSLLDYEILIVDYTDLDKDAKINRREVLDLEKKYPLINIRYLRSLETRYISALNQGISSARGELAAVLTAGSTVRDSFCFEAKNLFRQDVIAMALPLKNRPELQSLIANGDGGYRTLNLESVFTCPWISPSFVLRKAALEDIGGLSGFSSDHFLVKSLMLKLRHHGWLVNVDNNLEIMQSEDSAAPEKNALVAELSGVFAATIITEIQESLERHDFTKLRAKHGFALIFPEKLVEDSRQISSQYKDQKVL